MEDITDVTNIAGYLADKTGIADDPIFLPARVALGTDWSTLFTAISTVDK
jgi:hypothetical protein